MTRDEAIRKAAGLLRLAARGGTVEEAAAAAAKAEEILTRYELTAELVNGIGREPEEDVQTFGDAPQGWLDESKRLVRWRWELAHRLTRLHGCFCWQGHRGQGLSLELVGRPSAVETVRYLYAWLAAEVQRLTDTHGRGMGQVWRGNFARGAVQEIAARLCEQQEATRRAVEREHAANPHALVLVRSALQRIEEHRLEARELGYRVHRLVKKGGSSGRFNQTARDAGRAAGRTVNLGGRRRKIGSGS